MDWRVLAVSLFAGGVVCCVWLWTQTWNGRRGVARDPTFGIRRLMVAQHEDSVVVDQVGAVASQSPRAAAPARVPLPVPARQRAPAPAATSAALPVSLPQASTRAAPRSTSLHIQTLAQFRLLHRFASGVIVITNRGGRARAHHLDCSSLTTANFTKKVITNAGKGGGYFYFAHFEDAARELGANWCKTCAQPDAASVETPGVAAGMAAAG